MLTRPGIDEDKAEATKLRERPRQYYGPTITRLMPATTMPRPRPWSVMEASPTYTKF